MFSFFYTSFFFKTLANGVRRNGADSRPGSRGLCTYLWRYSTRRVTWRDETRRDKRIEDRLADGTKPDQILEFHASMSLRAKCGDVFFADNIDLTSPLLSPSAAKFFRKLKCSSLLTCHIEAVCFMLCLAPLAPPSLADNHTEKAWRTRQPRKQPGRQVGQGWVVV